MLSMPPPEKVLEEIKEHQNQSHQQIRNQKKRCNAETKTSKEDEKSYKKPKYPKVTANIKSFFSKKKHEYLPE